MIMKNHGRSQVRSNLKFFVIFIEIDVSVGADISDYFNYGFTEETWAQYCDRQRRLRAENNLARLNATHVNSSFVSLYSHHCVHMIFRCHKCHR